MVHLLLFRTQRAFGHLEYASRKNFSSLAALLKSRRDVDIARAAEALVAAGYLPEGALDNSAARDVAVRMYQNGKIGLTSSGVLDMPTLVELERDLSDKRRKQYKFVVRYQKKTVTGL